LGSKSLSHSVALSGSFRARNRRSALGYDKALGSRY